MVLVILPSEKKQNKKRSQKSQSYQKNFVVKQVKQYIKSL